MTISDGRLHDLFRQSHEVTEPRTLGKTVNALIASLDGLVAFL
jgi:hypothetical protein